MADSTESLPAAEIIRNFGYWQQQALMRPLTITHHGRARVMLISTEEYERLRAGKETPADPEKAPPKDTLLGAVLDNMAEGFAVFDTSLRVTKVNRVAEAYYGVSRDDLIGRTLAATINAAGNVLVEEILRRTIRTGEITTFETNSSLFPERRMSVRAFPHQDGVAVLFTNISEREQLRSAAEDWQALVAAMSCERSVGWLKLDGRGRVVEAGPGFEHMTGFSVEQLSAFKLFDIISSADRRRIQGAFEDVMHGQKPVDVEARLMVRDGQERRVRVCLAPVIRDFTATGAIAVLVNANDDKDVSSAAA